MGKEKGSIDQTAALPFSAALTNATGLRALSPFCRQGNTEVRVGHCPRKGKGRAHHHSRICRQHCLCNPGLPQAGLQRHGDQHLSESQLPSHKKEKRKNVSHPTGEQFQPHDTQMISATGMLCSQIQPSPDPSQSLPQTWPRGAVLPGMFTAPSGTYSRTGALSGSLPPCLSHKTHPSPGNNEHVLLGGALVVLCIWMPAGTVPA